MSHSVFGPSAAEKWLNCPGSIQMEAKLPPAPESQYANEGTVAHALAEEWLRTGRQPGVISNDMAGHLADYVQYVRSLEGYQEYEVTVRYDNWVPDGYGTADAIVDAGDTLYVVDLKYGKGVPVYADNNPQGKLYLLGAYQERACFGDYQTLIFTIYQPRLDSISHFSTTPSELLLWAEEVVRPAAKRCLASNPELIAGTKQCRWCAAKAVCPAPKMKAEEILMKEFDEMDDHLEPIDFLTDEQLRIILENKPMIINWLKDVEEHVMNKLLSGDKFEGFKIVHGRSNRKWADEAEAEKILIELLRDNAYVKKIISAPQAEKALGKVKAKEIQSLIVKPLGAPTLVSDQDQREEVVTITANDFDSI